MSPPEVQLWLALRLRPGGLQFRRQHPFGPYVLDFFCKAAALAIEVDGLAHELGDNPARDCRRDLWCRQKGIDTVRIRAEDVTSELGAVVAFIVDRCLERTPPPPPAVPLPAKLPGGSR